MCLIKIKEDPAGDFSVPARPVTRPPGRAHYVPPGPRAGSSYSQYLSIDYDERTLASSKRSILPAGVVERSPRSSRGRLNGGSVRTIGRSPRASRTLPAPDPSVRIPAPDRPIMLPAPDEGPSFYEEREPPSTPPPPPPPVPMPPRSQPLERSASLNSHPVHRRHRSQSSRASRPASEVFSVGPSSPLSPPSPRTPVSPSVPTPRMSGALPGREASQRRQRSDSRSTSHSAAAAPRRSGSRREAHVDPGPQQFIEDGAKLAPRRQEQERIIRGEDRTRRTQYRYT